jgi:hypothetical protein
MSLQELGRIHAEDHTLRVTSFPDRKGSYEELAVHQKYNKIDCGKRQV